MNFKSTPHPKENSSITVLPTQVAPLKSRAVTTIAVFSASSCVLFHTGFPNPVT